MKGHYPFHSAVEQQQTRENERRENIQRWDARAIESGSPPPLAIKIVIYSHPNGWRDDNHAAAAAGSKRLRVLFSTEHKRTELRWPLVRRWSIEDAAAQEHGAEKALHEHVGVRQQRGTVAVCRIWIWCVHNSPEFVNFVTDDAFCFCSPTGGPAASGGSRKFQRVVDGLELQHWLEKRKRNRHGWPCGVERCCQTAEDI